MLLYHVTQAAICAQVRGEAAGRKAGRDGSKWVAGGGCIVARRGRVANKAWFVHAGNIPRWDRGSAVCRCAFLGCYPMCSLCVAGRLAATLSSGSFCTAGVATCRQRACRPMHARVQLRPWTAFCAPPEERTVGRGEVRGFMCVIVCLQVTADACVLLGRRHAAAALQHAYLQATAARHTLTTLVWLFLVT